MKYQNMELQIKVILILTKEILYYLAKHILLHLK